MITRPRFLTPLTGALGIAAGYEPSIRADTRRTPLQHRADPRRHCGGGVVCGRQRLLQEGRDRGRDHADHAGPGDRLGRAFERGRHRLLQRRLARDRPRSRVADHDHRAGELSHPADRHRRDPHRAQVFTDSERQGSQRKDRRRQRAQQHFRRCGARLGRRERRRCKDAEVHRDAVPTDARSRPGRPRRRRFDRCGQRTSAGARRRRSAPSCQRLRCGREPLRRLGVVHHEHVDREERGDRQSVRRRDESNGDLGEREPPGVGRDPREVSQEDARGYWCRDARAVRGAAHAGSRSAVDRRRGEVPQRQAVRGERPDQPARALAPYRLDR